MSLNLDFLINLLPERVKKIPIHMVRWFFSYFRILFSFLSQFDKYMFYRPPQDFDGQRRAERLFQVILVLFGVSSILKILLRFVK